MYIQLLFTLAGSRHCDLTARREGGREMDPEKSSKPHPMYDLVFILEALLDLIYSKTAKVRWSRDGEKVNGGRRCDDG